MHPMTLGFIGPLLEIPTHEPGSLVNVVSVVYDLLLSLGMPLRRLTTIAILGIRVNVPVTLFSLGLWPYSLNGNFPVVTVCRLVTNLGLSVWFCGLELIRSGLSTLLVPTGICT